MEQVNPTPDPAPTPRDAAFAWLAALLFGLIGASIGFALIQPYVQASECISIPEYICPDHVAPPFATFAAIVAVISASEGVIVLWLVLRRLALRHQGRSPRPPLWASQTAVLIVGTYVTSWLAELAFVLATR